MVQARLAEFSSASFIANNTNRNSRTGMLVITGPNMGGKSTHMRHIAVIMLLACIGSYVPASSCRLGPIDAIRSRIGAADDLASAQSTFMLEMTEAAQMLHGKSQVFTLFVFLHEVQAGPASRRYGIQVARLAGMPTAVLQQAHQAQENNANASQAQVGLFAPPPNAEARQTSAVEVVLAGIASDALSPREALEVLYALKKAAAGTS